MIHINMISWSLGATGLQLSQLQCFDHDRQHLITRTAELRSLQRRAQEIEQWPQGAVAPLLVVCNRPKSCKLNLPRSRRLHREQCSTHSRSLRRTHRVSRLAHKGGEQGGLLCGILVLRQRARRKASNRTRHASPTTVRKQIKNKAACLSAKIWRTTLHRMDNGKNCKKERHMILSD